MNTHGTWVNRDLFKHLVSNVVETYSDDEYFLLLAKALSTDGYTCLRPPGAAGALLLFSKSGGSSQYVVIGCAEPPIGNTCREIGACEMENGHCVRTIHAEVNAILYAARHGKSTEGATLYSLLRPCYQCTKAIIAAGIDRIVFAGEAYNEDRTTDLLVAANVKFDYIDIGLTYGNA